MDQQKIKELLAKLKTGEVSVDEAVSRLRDLPFEDMEVACIDHHRSIRRGASEVIFGEGKEVEDILAIAERMVAQEENILITRLSPEKAEKIKKGYPEAEYYTRSRVLTLIKHAPETKGKGTILVISAGTSDIPVAEEAAVTGRFMGNEVDTLYDLGVSGLHRLLAHREKLFRSIGDYRGGRHGGGPAQRGRRACGQTGDRCALECRIRGEFPGHCRAFGHAEFVRVRRDGGQH